MGGIKPGLDPAGPEVERCQAATGAIQGSPRRGRGVRRHLGRIQAKMGIGRQRPGPNVGGH
eukprot:11921859-Heterocapsa_arctica.AAC.1